MEPDDRSLPPLPVPSTNPSIHTIPSASAISRPSTDDSRSRRRSSRASRESLEEEIKRTVKILRGQVEDERRRADNAERKLREVTAHLKAVNDARLLALRDAGRAKEELRIQLDTAQREIYRAQDVIGIVDRQRHTAEKEAAKNRNKARQLNETLLIQAAREEAWRLGLQEGLDRGRDLAIRDGPMPPEEEEDQEDAVDEDEYSLDESRSSSPESDHPSYQQPPRPQSIAPSQHSRRSRATTRPHPSPSPIPVPLPSNPLPFNPPTAPPSLHPSENIRPISVRTITPAPRMPNVVVPPDNLIPTLDADQRIRLPPPHEFTRTPERPVSALPAMSETSNSSQEPLPIPPRSYTPQQRRPRHRRNSSSGSNSSSLSQLDIVNNPYNPGLRSPMSIIQEVTSAGTASPNPLSENGQQSMRHRRSMSENSVQQRPPSVNALEETQSQRRPQSRSSYAEPWMQAQDRRSQISTSTAPNIKIQPPSQPSGSMTSLWAGESRGGASPSPSQRAPLPAVNENHDPSYASSSTPAGIPGGYTSFYQPPASTEPPVIPTVTPLHYEYRTPTRQSGYSNNQNDDDDAVSSAMSGDTLTTPPARHRPPEPDWSGAMSSAAQVPIPPASGMNRPGSSSTAIWNLPEAANGQSKRRNGKGASKGY
ncbi:hypothetical protein BDZ97DRAFT_1916408 [Flammula alnicola]|nr:hypothetical protein BDZ97DRAFT_1916408 [Flammula alnicola]